MSWRLSTVRLSDVQHQNRALAILRRAQQSGRMPHAYLFSGPEGVGKELAATALAARLLCTADTLSPDADACGICPTCQLFASGNHPDFHLIHRGLHRAHPDRNVRASKGLFLVVDLIRHFVIEPAGIKPTQGRRRVFIIRDAHRMNEEAQNALLKTLEEPPGTACLILVTSSATRLLPTIRSRCQQVPFNLLPAAFVADQLQKQTNLPPGDARALAGLAGGQLGIALRWHQMGLLDALDPLGKLLDDLPRGDVEAFGKSLIDLATDLAGRSPADPADQEDSESANSRTNAAKPGTDALRDGVKLTLLLLAAIYRDALLCVHNADQLGVLNTQVRQVKQLARSGEWPHLDACISAVSHAERMLDRNVAPQLVCERLGVALLGEATVV